MISLLISIAPACLPATRREALPYLERAGQARFTPRLSTMTSGSNSCFTGRDGSFDMSLSTCTAQTYVHQSANEKASAVVGRQAATKTALACRL